MLAKTLQAHGIGLVLAVLLASGCTPVTKPVPQEPGSYRSTQGEALVGAGNFEGAARLYLGLAASAPSPARETYQLAAIDALVKAGKDIEARRHAATLEASRLTPADRIRFDLINGQLELSAGNAERALEIFRRVSPESLSPEDRRTYHRQRAFAYSLTDKPLEEARERVFLHEILENSEERQKNGIKILEALGQIAPQNLAQLQPPPPDTLGGWMALARLMKIHQPGSEDYDRALTQWREVFPDHPAAGEFLKSYVPARRLPTRAPNVIGVLLPESGPYAEAAQAIREGMAASYYRHHGDGHKTTLRFYDSAVSDIDAVYRRAVTDGADFILGPLQKQGLENLGRKSSTLSIPVLALNQVPGLNKPNLYQFGLNPLDEAEQVANLAWSEGLRNAVLLAPRSDLGQRLAEHFTAYWQQLGGNVLTVQTYAPGDTDFSIPIRALRRLTTPPAPDIAPMQMSGAVAAPPHREKNADFLFLVAYPREGRLIRPQLQFYDAGHIPVFATSHIYGGRRNPAQDLDLDPIVFCDLPWLIQGYRGASDPMASNSAWRDFPDVYLRLIALGIDAYTLAPRLGTLRHSRYPGATGDLLLTEDNRIHRQLDCARFQQGIPRYIGPAPLNRFAGDDR